MSAAMKNPAKDAAEKLVAGPPAAPYTGPVGGDRNGARGAWWREGARSWIPMLAIGVTLVLTIQSQMLGMQRQIGDLRVEFRDELRAELRKELTPIRRDMAELRADVAELRTDMQDVKRRLTRIESEMAELRTGMEDVQNRLTRVEDRVTRIEGLVERSSQARAEFDPPGEVGAGQAANTG